MSQDVWREGVGEVWAMKVEGADCGGRGGGEGCSVRDGFTRGLSTEY